jgi:ATP-dependent protease ClpP protease subunit
MRLRDGGVFAFYHDVDEESYAEFCDDIAYLYLVKSFNGQVWIILNSAGGDVYHGLGIHDIVKSFVEKGAKINILGIGLVGVNGCGNYAGRE